MSPREFRLLTPEETESAPDIQEAWTTLVQDSRNLRVLYQSPAWWQCARNGDDGQFFLAAMGDPQGTLDGLCPVQLIEIPLTIDLLGRTLRRIRIKAAEILGGMPLLPDDESLHQRLFQGLLESLPAIDGIYLRNVRSDSYLWRLWRQSPRLRSQVLPYAPEAVGPFHSITMASSFPTYLAKFKADTRKKLQRKVRRLRDEGQGRLELERIESPCQVEHFLEVAAAIAEHTWQKRHLELGIEAGSEQRAHLMRCAAHGILRSYLLKCGDTYCSFGLGYQFQGVYYYVQIGFDERWAKFSPGTVQFFLVLEDVMQHRPAQRLDFGHGDWDFKRLFGTEHLDQASVLLLRKTLANRVLVAGHASYYASVRGLKRLLRRDKDYVRPKDGDGACGEPAGHKNGQANSPRSGRGGASDE